MPGDSYIPTGTTKQVTEKVYDPVNKKWVDKTTNSVTTSEGVQVATNTTPTTVKATSSTIQAGTSSSSSSKTTSNSNTKTSADKKVIEQEFNTLEGDMQVIVCQDTIKIAEGDTIYLHGVGKNLSGLYYVSKVSHSLDDSQGLSISLTVIKTGFGDSLKSGSQDSSSTASDRPAEVQKTVSSISAGDKVKITGSDAVYSNASEGVRVPDWVKEKTLTVSQVSKDSTRVLLSEINSWTYTKYVKKV